MINSDGNTKLYETFMQLFFYYTHSFFFICKWFVGNPFIKGLRMNKKEQKQDMLTICSHCRLSLIVTWSWTLPCSGYTTLTTLLINVPQLKCNIPIIPVYMTPPTQAFIVPRHPQKIAPPTLQHSPIAYVAIIRLVMMVMAWQNFIYPVVFAIRASHLEATSRDINAYIPGRNLSRARFVIIRLTKTPILYGTSSFDINKKTFRMCNTTSIIFAFLLFFQVLDTVYDIFKLHSATIRFVRRFIFFNYTSLKRYDSTIDTLLLVLAANAFASLLS